MQVARAQSVGDLARVRVGVRGDRAHHGMLRCEPKGQVPGVMLDQYAREALDRAEHGAMEHHRHVTLAVLADVGRPEPAGQVEVHLHGAALPVAADRVAQHELELRAVERALAGIVGVLEAGRVDRDAERGLRLVPDCVRAHPRLGAVGELDPHVVEPEVAVDGQDQIAHRDRFLRDLVRGAEDMGIVLGERAHPHQPVQRPGRLVAVHLAELGDAHRQAAVAPDRSGFEDLHVSGAVHGLEREHPAVLGLRGEHVLAERLPVAGRLPQAAVHELRGVDLDVAGRALTLADVVDEPAKEPLALRMPERGPRRLVLEMEQIHLAPEPAMVAALGLLEHVQVGLELLLVRPRGAVDALEHLVVGVAAPVRTRDPHQPERLAQLPGGRQVRAAAEIDPLALAVQRDGLVARNALDDLRLVLLAPVAEEPDRLVAVPHLARDRLVAIDDLAHALLHALQILGGEGLLAREVVVEPVLDGGSDGDLGLRPELLDRLGEDVGRVVAQQLQRLPGIPGHDRDRRVGLDGGGEVAHRAVDLDRERRPGESLADARGDVGPRHRSVEVPGGAVGQCDTRHVVSVLQMMRRSPMG